MRTGVYLTEQNRFVRFYLSMHIKQKRESLGLSVDDMVRRLGISTSYYQRLEAGHVRIEEDLFSTIVEIIDLKEDDLFELIRIANVAQANALAKDFGVGFPNDL